MKSVLQEIIDKAKLLLPDSSSYPSDEIRVSMMRIATTNVSEIEESSLPAEDNDNYCITLAFRKSRQGTTWQFDGVR